MVIRIVIVDDDPLVRAGVRALLNQADGILVVDECADGVQVMAVADAVHPDVVLMDLQMPVMGGGRDMEPAGQPAGRQGDHLDRLGQQEHPRRGGSRRRRRMRHQGRRPRRVGERDPSRRGRRNGVAGRSAHHVWLTGRTAMFRGSPPDMRRRGRGVCVISRLAKVAPALCTMPGSGPPSTAETAGAGYDGAAEALMPATSGRQPPPT